MASFSPKGSLSDFQKFNHRVYGIVDDRYYTTADLIAQVQRFAMRALKGIRKRDKRTLTLNLLISFSWLNAIASRISMNIEEEVWKRFPMLCSYCGQCPCACKLLKVTRRRKVRVNNRLKPKTLAGYQEMFEQIYPSERRTLADAGIHLAEEIGETSEATHNYMGEHAEEQLDAIKLELADTVSCMLGVANSAQIHFASELAKLFKNNCHVCHKVPCICKFNRTAHY